MLQRLRDHSGKWFIKVLFGAIVLSFVVWGIADVIRGIQANRAIAKVNGHGITLDEYTNALSRSISHFQQMVRSRLTGEQLRQLGIHRSVLDDMISERLIEDELTRLQLTVSDNVVRSVIYGMKGFQRDGQFDRQLFTEVLRQNHTTEQKFIGQIKRDIITNTFYGALSEGAGLPAYYVNAIIGSLHNLHVFTAVTIPFHTQKIKETATDETLRLFYDQRQEAYRTLEYRSATVMFIDLKKLSESAAVSEEEITEEYNRRLSEFSTPERRTVQRYTVPSRKAAEALLTKVKAGRPAKAIVRDIPNTDFSEELVEKEQLAEDVREAVFAVAAGQHTAILERPFGFTVYCVQRVEPAQTKTLPAVRDQILSDLRLQKMSEHVKDFRNKIEDDIAAGKKLADIAKENNLKFEVIPAFAKTGLTPEGRDAFSQNMNAKVRALVLENAFNLAQGQESSLIDIEEYQSMIVGVDAITPSATPAFEIIKSRVNEDWQAEQKKEAAREAANTLSHEATTLNALTSTSSQYGYVVTSGISLSEINYQRFRAPKDDKNTQAIPDLFEKLDPRVVERAFALKSGQLTVGEIQGGYVVIMLEKIVPNIPPADTAQKMLKTMQGNYQRDVQALLLKALRAKASITEYTDILEQVMHHES
jgi:peptidyl-prolyl cis-trans isomerase D